MEDQNDVRDKQEYKITISEAVNEKDASEEDFVSFVLLPHSRNNS